MVENITRLLSFSNEETYIDEDTVASLLQSMLNTAYGDAVFGVYVGNKATTSRAEKYTAILKTRIEPYMLKNSHCVSVEVRLSIDLPIENSVEKLSVSRAIGKCLGFLQGVFKAKDEEGNERDFTFCCNFGKDERGTPENVNSKYTSQYPLRGTMHITRADGGLLTDVVENYIVIGNNQYKIIARTFDGAWSANTEVVLKAGKLRPDVEYVSETNAKALVMLYKGDDELSQTMRDIVEGKVAVADNPFIDQETGKPVLKLKQVYPDKTITTEYYITEMRLTGEAGAYMAFNISLIRK